MNHLSQAGISKAIIQIVCKIMFLSWIDRTAEVNKSAIIVLKWDGGGCVHTNGPTSKLSS